MPASQLLRRVARWIVASVVFGGVMMALQGDWASPFLWGLTFGFSGVFAYASISMLDDDLAQERFRPPTQGADAVALRWIRLTALTAFLFAPLDSGRLHWSSTVPAPLRMCGIVGFVVGFWFVVFAMKTNRYFSAVIRIQDDRGHRVVDRGPYAMIRHPGYLGMIVVAPMVVLALGSWWALVPALAYSALIARRVIVEDRFLRLHLAGYDAYAARVPHRVIPGVW